uniref:Uncharacterized protein n=1 Tax=Stegastes partitus TaxID=144197 RepID=A0A3B4ZFF3_9TELE
MPTLSVFQIEAGHLLTTTHGSLLLSENEVYAWGNNTMGQCGQGHTSTPITKPKKVLGLEGVSIQQITAGTSHSLAWTQFWGGDSPGPAADTRYVGPATLFIQLC